MVYYFVCCKSITSTLANVTFFIASHHLVNLKGNGDSQLSAKQSTIDCILVVTRKFDNVVICIKPKWLVGVLDIHFYSKTEDCHHILYGLPSARNRLHLREKREKTGFVLLLTAALLLTGCANSAAAAGDDYGVIHVAGKVMCQDCSKSYNEGIKGDRLIKGCKVSLACFDDRERVIDYVSDKTDEAGQFEMTVSKYIHGKKLKEKLCSVRLVSSPDPTCNILRDFAGGKSDVKLERPTFVYRDFVK